MSVGHIRKSGENEKVGGFDGLGSIMAAAIVIIFTGMVFLRKGLVKKEDVQSLNTLIIYLGMPSLIFLAVWQSDLSTDLIKIPILANATVLSCLVISSAVSRLMKLDRRSAGSFIIASAFGNTAFLGFPLIISVFGRENLVYGVFYDQFSTGILGLSLGAGLASWYGSGKGGVSGAWKNIVRFPPFWGLVLGFILRGYPIPEFLMTTLEYLSALVVPLVMLVLGMSLRTESVGKLLSVSLVASFIKLLVSPLILVLFSSFVTLETIPFQVSLLQASMPSMMMTLSFAIRYDLDTEMAAAIILVSLVLSTITAPFILSLF